MHSEKNILPGGAGVLILVVVGVAGVVGLMAGVVEPLEHCRTFSITH